MGTSIDASLEAKLPPTAWILAPESANGTFFSTSSLMPTGDPFGLMQGINSNWITLKKPPKQEPSSPLLKNSASISCLHHLPDPQANPPRFPISNPLTDWHRAAAESLAPGNYSEAKAPRIHVPFPNGLNRTFPFLCYNHGDLINMSNMTPKEIMDAKALAASKSHSEAERRRRERINTHLATLRSLLPGTIKTDKASLLAEVVHRVKELKRQAAEVAQISSLPSDADELQVDADASLGEDRVLIRASLCCNDRPALFSDLSRAIKEIKLRATKIQIVALGGRMKNVIFMTCGDRVPFKQEGLPVTSVQDTLRAVIEKSASNELTTTNFFGTKRQRLGHHGSSQVL